VYRQIIDQVQAAISAEVLAVGDQLPTVRQVAVDLVINPNTVSRAYREMEIRGTVDTQQGSGTFIANKKIETTGNCRLRRGCVRSRRLPISSILSDRAFPGWM
jgi:DNA-binding transcriptional regulator YhcF (GntR family)